MEIAITEWLNSINFLPKIKQFQELQQGNVFHTILNHINPEYFQLSYFQNHDQAIQWANLRIIMDKIHELNGQVLNINILSIVMENNQYELLKLFEIVCKLMLESNRKDDFFKPVLTLQDDQQLLITEFVKTLCQYPQDNYQNLLHKIDELEAENHKLSLLNQQNHYIIEELTQQNQSYEEQILKEKEQHNNIQHQFSIFQQTCDIQNELLQLNLKDSQIQIWESKEKIDELEKQIQNNNKQLNKFKEYESENEQLKTKIRELIVIEEKYQSYKDKLIDNRELQTKLGQLQNQFTSINYQLLQEQKNNINLELDVDKFKSLYEDLSQQNHELIERLRQVSLRQSRICSRRQSTDDKTTIDANPEHKQLSSELQTQHEFSNIHQSILSTMEEQHRKEQEILLEKIKQYEISANGWKQIIQTKEQQIRYLEQKEKQYYSNDITDQITRQNEQIQRLVGTINQFSIKYKQLCK
ncbi:hypothetical protein pb186bvf_018840 [Paramecium bursaria]